jgi:hypothetical protein
LTGSSRRSPDTFSDPVSLIDHLFVGGRKVVCLEAADFMNDGAIDVSDVIASLGTSPGPPASPCGVDTDTPGSSQDLGCAIYTPCDR